MSSKLIRNYNPNTHEAISKIQKFYMIPTYSETIDFIVSEFLAKNELELESEIRKSIKDFWDLKQGA